MTIFRDIFISAPDGLRLHARDYGPALSDALPVVCLPGLARTAADFDSLARSLADDSDHPRRVLALDSRGRGRSEHDRDPKNYTLAVELADLIAVLTALGITSCVFVGTSRGGLLTMLLAVAQPSLIAGVVLNDIGPLIEPPGLLRIKSYVGKMSRPRDLAEGAEILRRLFDGQFPKLVAADWHAAAERTWEMHHGRLELTYDPRLSQSLESFDPSQSLPPLWDAFDALAGVPLMVIRGANSDILTAATVEAMRSRRQDMDSIVVEDQGHAPLLAEPPVLRRIAAFVQRCDIANCHRRA